MIKSMPTRYAIFHENENPIFGENTIHIDIDDEAGGPFFVLFDCNGIEIRVELEELKMLVAVAERMEKQYNDATGGNDG